MVGKSSVIGFARDQHRWNRDWPATDPIESLNVRTATSYTASRSTTESNNYNIADKMTGSRIRRYPSLGESNDALDPPCVRKWSKTAFFFLFEFLSTRLLERCRHSYEPRWLRRVQRSIKRRRKLSENRGKICNFETTFTKKEKKKKRRKVGGLCIFRWNFRFATVCEYPGRRIISRSGIYTKL